MSNPISAVWKVAKSAELWEISDITSIALKQTEPAKPLYCASNNLKCNSLLGSSSHFLAAKRARRVYLTSSVCWVRLVTVSSNHWFLWQCFLCSHRSWREHGRFARGASNLAMILARLDDVYAVQKGLQEQLRRSLTMKVWAARSCTCHVKRFFRSSFEKGLNMFEQFQNTQVDADWSKWLSLAPRQWT